jgi:hypothetical protein
LLEIWQSSGHLHERGRCRGQFQMCRLGDVGPYASSTVRKAAKHRLRLGRSSLYGARTATSLRCTYDLPNGLARYSPSIDTPRNREIPPFQYTGIR